MQRRQEERVQAVVREAGTWKELVEAEASEEFAEQAEQFSVSTEQFEVRVVKLEPDVCRLT